MENEQPEIKKRYRVTTAIGKLAKIAMLTAAIVAPTTLLYNGSASAPNVEYENLYTMNPELKVLARYIVSRNSKVPTEIAELISKIIIDESDRSRLPVELIVAIIEHESLFNPMASSTAGAMGLMQILRGETITVDKDQAYNIQYNISTGCEILRGKLKIVNGDLPKALTNYSGLAADYSLKVLSCVGRYTMYRHKEKTKEEAIKLVRNMVRTEEVTQ